jgi:hypothetical protein
MVWKAASVGRLADVAIAAGRGNAERKPWAPMPVWRAEGLDQAQPFEPGVATPLPGEVRTESRPRRHCSPWTACRHWCLTPLNLDMELPHKSQACLDAEHRIARVVVLDETVGHSCKP